MARRLTPLPVTSIGTWENSRIVDAIIDEAELGQFFNASLLVDQVLRDDRIRGVFMTRVYGLLGKPLHLEPAKGPRSGEAKGKKIADEVEAEWCDLFAHDAL